MIGGIGGLISTAGIMFLERLKVDDVVGAIPAHLFAGVWGTIAVCISAGGTLWVQLVGIVSIGAFAFIGSWILWTVLDKIMTLRVSENVELLGQDMAELGIEAYPEFMLMPDRDEYEELLNEDKG